MSAPVFSSFPPVFDSFPTNSSTHRQPGSTKEPSTKHDRHEKKPKSLEEGQREGRRERDGQGSEKHKKKGHRREKSGRDERDRSSERRSNRRGQMLDDDNVHGGSRAATSNRIYYIDRKGDELNVKYGSLHAGDIPKYSHVARGRQVLGLESNLTVVYRGSKGLEIGEAGWFSKSPQLTDSRARTRLLSGKSRHLSSSSKAALKYEEADGFVRFPSRKGKEKDQEHRSITLRGHSLSESDSSSGEESISSDKESDMSPLSAREEALRDLEKRLLENPASESNWLNLLHHSISGVLPTGKNAEKTRAEIAISILERSFSVHPANNRSPFLRLKYLRAGEAVWDAARTNDEWDKALRSIPTVDMYIEWLDWAMRTMRDFDSVLEKAVKAIDFVSRASDDRNGDHARLRVFWRIATFLRQAGFVERGFALLQAQAELSFNVPEKYRDCPFHERLDALEEFWESEVPRVGDAGSKGWRASWTCSQEQGLGSRPRGIGQYNSQDPYAMWHFNEVESDTKLMFPARISCQEETADEDQDAYEDPYCAVLYSDLRPFLVELRTGQGRDVFILIWISYLGLHVPGLSAALSSDDFSWDDRWADTYFLRPSFIQSLFPASPKSGLITADSQTGVVVGREKTYAKSFDSVKSWALGAIEPLDGLTVDGRYRTWTRDCLSGIDNEILNAISRIVSELRHDDEQMDWRVVELAILASFPSSESALKHSQALLSKESSSAELLAAHAYLERIRQKYDKARKVYRVGLQSLATSKDPSVVFLWWGAAELEWLLSESEATLEVILHATGQTNDKSGVAILRARRRLDELCLASNVPVWKFRIRWLKLRILFELLVGTVDAAIGISQTLLEGEELGSMPREALTVASLVLLYHHTISLRNPTPPSILRNFVHAALGIYQDNSIIIGIFLECEKGESIWGRVRALTTGNTAGALQEKSVARRLMEVWMARWEEGRWLNEVERVRAGLEAAVTSERTKGSPILWKTYVKFEIVAGNLKRAKAVLFRALKECPFVKELYLLAFEDDLRNVYSRRELLDLSDTMSERGIRLRQALGEVLNVRRQGDAESSDASMSADEDELECRSREMKRLMPY